MVDEILRISGLKLINNEGPKEYMKKKNILLVEPNYDTPFPPLGLMKISTWLKSKGHDVRFHKGIKHFNEDFDEIYITSLFTYFADEVIDTVKAYKKLYPEAEIKIGGIMSTLMPKFVKDKTGIMPHLGLLKDAEFCTPDYSYFPQLPYSITFTTRGCPNRCQYCSVHKHEPEFFAKEHWERDIDISKKYIIAWDNNWFASPNIAKDVEKFKKFDKIVDFNQGLDCRLFDEDKAKLVSQIRIRPFRFAFDNMSQDGHIQKAILLAQKYSITDIRSYVLYNFTDDPASFYYRINELNKLKTLSYPMRYRPLHWGEKRLYVNNKWTFERLRALKLILMFFYYKGMIANNRERFLTVFGKNSKEFVKRLDKVYEDDMTKYRKRKSEKKEPKETAQELSITNYARYK